MSLRAWASNFLHSAAVYPSPRTSRSSLRSGGPLRWISITGPAGAGGEVSTNMSFGSTVSAQISRKAWRRSRFFTTSCTGRSGAAKRKDSWKVRFTSRASPVVSHSPNTVA